MIRKRYQLSGRVQGVGLRWRAAQAARLYDCTGWCRNEWDGSVTMEIQGELESINAVMRVLLHDRYIRIEGIETETIPLQEERRFRTE